MEPVVRRLFFMEPPATTLITPTEFLSLNQVVVSEEVGSPLKPKMK